MREHNMLSSLSKTVVCDYKSAYKGIKRWRIVLSQNVTWDS